MSRSASAHVNRTGPAPVFLAAAATGTPSVWIDRFASARYFDGFHDRPPDPLPAHAPVVAPRLWLVTTGWRRFGLLAPDDTPGVAP